MAANPFHSLLVDLPKPDGGKFGSYYSLKNLGDSRVGEPEARQATFRLHGFFP